MNSTNSQLEESLRQGFKYFNRFMLALWRLGLGPWINFWPEGSGQIMVITHIGRKSGLRRRTPVNYVIVDDEVYCTAGFGHISDWYRNILANPKVEVWLPNGWWAGEAQDISNSEDRIQIMRKVIIASGFAGRIAGLDPLMSDEAFAEATNAYKLIHIKRTEARTGSDGPGDLAWIWPLATFILLPLALRRRRRS